MLQALDDLITNHFGRLGIQTEQGISEVQNVDDEEELESEGINIQERVQRFLQEVEEVNTAVHDLLDQPVDESSITEENAYGEC